MNAKSFSELRRTLAATIDQVADDHAPMLITRKGGKPAAVILSAEDFASYEETIHLLSSPENARRLLASIEELEGGRGSERELAD